MGTRKHQHLPNASPKQSINDLDNAHALIFLYLGAPLIIGAIMGWNRVRFDPSTPLRFTLFFWITFALLIWIGAAIGSWSIYRLLKSFRPPLWLITFFGPLLSALVFAMPYRAIIRVSDKLDSADAKVYTPRPIGINPDLFFSFIIEVLPGALLWMGLNLVYDRILMIPRYPYAAKPQPSKDSTPNVLNTLLPNEKQGELLAIKAEDHYVRVYTVNGDGLLYMRFTDALESVQDKGIRTHRSWWVARKPIENLIKQGQSYYVKLDANLIVPVSRSYLNDVRTAFIERNPKTS